MSRGDPTADDDLLRCARGGDRRAFDSLYERHFEGAFRLAFRLSGGDRDLAADAAQEAFVTLILGARGYRYEGKLRAYLLRTVANYLRQHARAARTFQRRCPTFADPPCETPPDPSDEAVGERARRALGDLPLPQREVVTLRVYEEMTFPEIAQVLGCPVDTVKTRYRRAAERLRRALTDGDEGEERTR